MGFDHRRAERYVADIRIFEQNVLVRHWLHGMCVYNDICDADFDGRVERTKNRPLPAGIVSISGAAIFCTSLFIPVIYLLSYENPLSRTLELIGICFIHSLYPFMKRWTYWPQAWLGLSFNWGILVAWASIDDRVPPVGLWIMCIGSICWTIVYDTIYACQDREDDARLGLKSTALLFGDQVKPILAVLSAVFVLALAYTGRELGQNIGFAIVSCGSAVVHSVWQLWAWDVDNGKDHRAKFESNGILAVMIWLGLVYDYICALAR
ncbi:UbiA prenyltransferase [Lenzites betulinus]|nr:UbiA prenyltransferase [Lenzites betulinus]